MNKPIALNGSAGITWLRYCDLIMNRGQRYYDEKDIIRELYDVCLTFDSFNENDTLLKKFADPKLIKLYVQKIEKTEIVPELNSSYGKRLLDQLGVNQIDWLVNRLKNKPETKAATISLLLPNDPGPRIPCLCIIDLKLRYGQLHLTGFFRSQNALRSYGNFIGIHRLHKNIARSLDCKIGKMKFFVSSAHIYEKDAHEMQAILSDAKKLLSERIVNI